MYFICKYFFFFTANITRFHIKLRHELLENDIIIKPKIYLRGESLMKKFISKYSAFIAALALVVTTLTANSTCVYCLHQEKMPEASKKLRKF